MSLSPHRCCYLVATPVLLSPYRPIENSPAISKAATCSVEHKCLGSKTESAIPSVVFRAYRQRYAWKVTSRAHRTLRTFACPGHRDNRLHEKNKIKKAGTEEGGPRKQVGESCADISERSSVNVGRSWKLSLRSLRIHAHYGNKNTYA